VFALDRGAHAQRTIQVPTMQLLLEGVRRLDEQSAPDRQGRGSEIRLRAVGSSGNGSAPALRGGASKPPPVPDAARKRSSAPPIRSAGPPPAISASDLHARTLRPPELVRLPVPPPAAGNGRALPAEQAATEPTPEQRAAEGFERGMQLTQEKRYDEALCEWERAVLLAPDDRKYQFNLRRLRELVARRTEAEARGLHGNQE
jgi:hypothetical protein